MRASQQLNRPKFLCRASSGQRIAASIVFLVVIVLFSLSRLAIHHKINIDRWIGPCGFKQKYDLPCPGCGMTTSVLTFAQGKILEAFYIQPAAALLCCILVAVAFLSFFIAVFGVYFCFLKGFFAEVKVRHIILALVVIIVAGWAVTLARAMVATNQG